MLEKIKNPWRGLKDILNTLIAAINKNQVIAGAGIVIDTTSPNGTVVALATNATASEGAAGTPTDGAWLTIDVMDSSCNRTTIQVWSRSVPTGPGL